MTPLALPLEANRAMPKLHGNSHRPVTGAMAEGVLFIDVLESESLA
jgi:hypothetical protein